jgi:tetratricopeptide (TPR) repeat protein
LEAVRSYRLRIISASLSLVLGLLVLGPRIVSQVNPEIGVAHFKNYLVFDKIRNRNARILLEDFYRSRGDTVQARQARTMSMLDFPEVRYNDRARQLYSQNKYSDAIGLWQQAISIDPIYYDAYNNLGAAYLDLNRPDLALPYLEISDGLNPYNALTTYNIGTVYLRENDLKRAEKLLVQALKLDTTTYNAAAALVDLHIRKGEYSRVPPDLAVLNHSTDFPAGYFLSIADTLLTRQAYSEAAQAYRYALGKGLDSAYVRQRESRYPALRL